MTRGSNGGGGVPTVEIVQCRPWKNTPIGVCHVERRYSLFFYGLRKTLPSVGKPPCPPCHVERNERQRVQSKQLKNQQYIRAKNLVPSTPLRSAQDDTGGGRCCGKEKGRGEVKPRGLFYKGV